MILENSCTLCSKFFNSALKLFKLVCGCKLCKSCIIIKLKQATNEKIYLNIYEKKHIKLNPTKCVCNAIFDINSTINLISNELTEYCKKSFERLAAMAFKYCLLCEISVIDKSREILMVKLLDQENNFNHVICVKCHDKNKNLRLDSLSCLICDCVHQIDLTIWNTNVKKVEKESCSSCCIII